MDPTRVPAAWTTSSATGLSKCPTTFDRFANLGSHWLIDIKKDVDTCGRHWWPQWIHTPAASTHFFEDNIQSEIGRVICMMLKPENCPVDHLKQRLEWMKLITRTARPEILLKVEWQPVLSWLCRSFDEKSWSSSEFLNTLVEELDGLAQRTSSKNLPALPPAYHGHFGVVRAGDGEVTRTSGPAEDLESFQRLWEHATWEDPYTVQSPFTHLLLCASIHRGHDAPSTKSYPRRIQFLHQLLNCGVIVINGHTLWFLIGWHSHQRNDQLAFPSQYPQLSDQAFEKLLKKLCQIRIDSTGLRSDPAGITSWLTKALLPFALQVNHESAVHLLLNMGANPNKRDEQGRTILMRADDPDVFQVLLRHKSTDLDARDNFGHTNVLTSLVLRGLSLQDEQARRKGRQHPREKEKLSAKLKQVVAQIKLLLRRSQSDIANSPGEQGGMTPLALAMGCSTLTHIDVIGRVETTQPRPWLLGTKTLLEAGANPNVRVPMPSKSTRYDTWILHRTMRRKTRETAAVDLLLDHGVDVTNRDRFGRTAADLGNAIRWYPRVCAVGAAKQKKAVKKIRKRN